MKLREVKPFTQGHRTHVLRSKFKPAPLTSVSP